MIQLELDTQYTLKVVPNDMTDEQFLQFCMANKHMRIERDKDRNIIVMPPVHLGSSKNEITISSDIDMWARKNGGEAFNASAGYTLPSGAVRSPDASWVSQERYDKMPEDEMWKFAAVVPDFVVEVRSKSDRLKKVKAKMSEWMENGVRLAWLIDPKTKTTYIYRENGSIEVLEGFDRILTGEDVMEDFEFDLKWIKIHK